MPSLLDLSVSYVLTQNYPQADEGAGGAGDIDEKNPAEALFKRKMAGMDPEDADKVRIGIVRAYVNALMVAQPAEFNTENNFAQKKRVKFDSRVVEPDPRRGVYAPHTPKTVASSLASIRTIEAGDVSIKLTWGTHQGPGSINWGVAMAELKWYAERLPTEPVDWQVKVDGSENFMVGFIWVNLCFTLHCLDSARGHLLPRFCESALGTSAAFADRVVPLVQSTLERSVGLSPEQERWYWKAHSHVLVTHAGKSVHRNVTLATAMTNLADTAGFVATTADYAANRLREIRKLLEAGHARSFGITIDRVDVLIKALALVECGAGVFCQKEDHRRERFGEALSLPHGGTSTHDVGKEWFSQWEVRAKSTKNAYSEYYEVMKALVRSYRGQDWKPSFVTGSSSTTPEGVLEYSCEDLE